MRSSKWSIAEARLWQRATAPHQHAMRMVRQAVEELFGPIASVEGEEAVSLRRPDDPVRDAEAIITALHRVAQHMRETRH